jgi:hypothetical protein
MRSRDIHDYTYVDWLYGPTALQPADLAPPFLSSPRRRSTVSGSLRPGLVTGLAFSLVAGSRRAREQRQPAGRVSRRAEGDARRR